MTRTTIRSEDITAGAVDTTSLETDIALLGFKVAANGSMAAYNLKDQTIDAFEDASGVDASSSTNEVRNASNYYSATTQGTTTHTFSYTGSDQTLTTPAATVSGVVKAFGANGNQYQGNGAIGQGGFVEATVPLSASTSYLIVVGEDYNGDGNYGYGGGGGRRNDSAGGGGLSGIFTGTSALDYSNSSSSGAASQGRALVIAGGGGGAGASWSGGFLSADGGHVGSDGQGQNGENNASGGAGGTGGNETYMAGGIGQASGGAGYYGGSAGGGGGGGGAGDNYIHSSSTNTASNTGRNYSSDSDEPATSKGYVKVTTTQQSYLDLTLVSVGNTAESVPTKGDIVMTYTNGAGTATVNTDLKAYISRDNGTTWTQATLTSEGTTGGHSILTAHNVDISSQPSGTSMRYKITTHNQSASKETRIQAVSLGWS
jgi:hypothetical protein